MDLIYQVLESQIVKETNTVFRSIYTSKDSLDRPLPSWEEKYRSERSIQTDLWNTQHIKSILKSWFIFYFFKYNGTLYKEKEYT